MQSKVVVVTLDQIGMLFHVNCELDLYQLTYINTTEKLHPPSSRYCQNLCKCFAIIETEKKAY